MPLLRDYIAEHERATNFGGEAVRAIDRGDLGHARHLLGEMATELASHWQGEETGLFRVMAGEEMFAEAAKQSLEYLDQLDPYVEQELTAYCNEKPPASGLSS